MDYILTDFTLEEMLSAFSEEAEVEYENAKIDRPPEAQIELLRVRYLACKSRETIAQLLLHDLQHEAHIKQDSEIAISQDSISKPCSHWTVSPIGPPLDTASTYLSGLLTTPSCVGVKRVEM